MFTKDKMNLNGFSLAISAIHGDSEKVKIDGTDYFSLTHGSEYSLSLSNDRSSRCDAYVYIDGENVGVWRISPYSTINIERPANVKRKFVFLAEDSVEAEDAGIPPGSSENGLVKVIFKPEKLHTSICKDSQQSYGMNRMDGHNFSLGRSADSFSAGATGLGDRSFQSFSTVGKLSSIDHSNVTTIQTRLVVPNYHSSPRVVRLRDGLKRTPYPKRIHSHYPRRVNKDCSWWNLPYLEQNDDRDDAIGTWF